MASNQFNTSFTSLTPPTSFLAPPQATPAFPEVREGSSPYAPGSISAIDKQLKQLQETPPDTFVKQAQALGQAVNGQPLPDLPTGVLNPAPPDDDKDKPSGPAGLFKSFWFNNDKITGKEMIGVTAVGSAAFLGSMTLANHALGLDSVLGSTNTPEHLKNSWWGKLAQRVDGWGPKQGTLTHLPEGLRRGLGDMDFNTYLHTHDASIAHKMLDDLQTAGKWTGWVKGSHHPTQQLYNTYAPMIHTLAKADRAGLLALAAQHANNAEHPIHGVLASMNTSFLKQVAGYAPETLDTKTCEAIMKASAAIPELKQALTERGIASLPQLLANKEALKEVVGEHSKLGDATFQALWEKGFKPNQAFGVWDKALGEAPAYVREAGYSHVLKHLQQSYDTLPQTRLHAHLDDLVKGHIPRPQEGLIDIGGIGRALTGWIPGKGLMADLFNKGGLAERASQTSSFLKTQWPLFQQTGQFSNQAQFETWVKQIGQAQSHSELNTLLGSVQKEFATQLSEVRGGFNIMNGAVAFIRQRYHDTHVFAQQTDELARGFGVTGAGKAVASVGSFLRNLTINQPMDQPQEVWMNKLINKGVDGNIFQKIGSMVQHAGAGKLMFLAFALMTFTQAFGATTKEKDTKEKAKIFGWEFISTGMAFMATAAIAMKAHSMVPTLLSKLVPFGRGFTNFLPSWIPFSRAGGGNPLAMTMGGAILGLGSQLFLMDKIKGAMHKPFELLFGKPASVKAEEAKAEKEKVDSEKKKSVEQLLKVQQQMMGSPSAS
ncbi:MAG: hypothetical protein ACKO34_04985 [Vampirovibrionales bacterium]